MSNVQMPVSYEVRDIVTTAYQMVAMVGEEKFLGTMFGTHEEARAEYHEYQQRLAGNESAAGITWELKVISFRRSQEGRIPDVLETVAKYNTLQGLLVYLATNPYFGNAEVECILT